MKVRGCIAVLIAAVLLGMDPSPLSAGEHDERALEVLRAMSEYKSSQDTLVRTGNFGGILSQISFSSDANFLTVLIC